MKNDLEIEKIKITNPDKLLFDNITKKELALYYQKVASKMLPYLKNRIISTVRCPDGINGQCFYKKHLGIYNDGIKMINIPSDNDNKDDYYYITKTSGIISEVQMNTIEFHIWGCQIKNIDKPDIMVFDLDPDEKLDLKEIRLGVKHLKSILDELSLTSFLKTSGGKGYHVVVPFKTSTNWNDFYNFAKNVALIMETKWPELYTTNIRKENRKGKIFIDYLRNSKSSTSVAPYSVRTKKRATVSMPIKWTELDKVAPDSFTINDVLKKIKNKDPWENFYTVKQYLK